MQTGSYKIQGDSWWFKYREWVFESGVKKRKDRYAKLCKVERGSEPKPGYTMSAGGSVPSEFVPKSVEKLAYDVVSKVNSRDHKPVAADSLESVLDLFLEAGIGGRGEKLRESTLTDYNDKMRVIRPFLTDIEIGRVDTPYIDRLLREVADADDATDRGRRHQYFYRNLKNGFLASAFKHAVRMGLTKYNPIRDAVAPKGAETDTHAYTLEEFQAMMNALDEEGAEKNHTVEAMMVVLMFTGLRISELKGLRWEDWDQKKQILNVRRAVDDNNKINEPKTKASKAPVPVIKTVAKKLAEHLKRNSGTGYIFHAEDLPETPVRPNNIVRRDIDQVFEKNKVEWHGWHAFRRGLESALVAAGTDEQMQKVILRHEFEDVTGKHYLDRTSDAVVERARKEIEKVEKKYLALK